MKWVARSAASGSQKVGVFRVLDVQAQKVGNERGVGGGEGMNVSHTKDHFRL
jgi:hypothetical protein